MIAVIATIRAKLGGPTGTTIMRSIVLLIVVAASALSMAACNTVKGAGRDVSSVGNAVSDTAEDAKH